MIGPLSAVRRLTSTVSGLATSTVRTGAAVATTAMHSTLDLVRRESSSPARHEEGQTVPTPTRVPSEPDVARKTAEAARSAASQDEPAATSTQTKAPKKAASKKAAPKKAAPKKAAAGAPNAPKPSPPKKQASEVPLKSDPTPSSAAPPEPEGPDAPAEELGVDGATGLAEAEPLLDDATAKQVAAETETLRRAAEQA